MTSPRPVLMVRLRTLATLELVNIIWIGWAVFMALDAPMSAANTVGYALVAGHLFIGAGYWVVKRRQLRAGSRRPPMIGVFRRLEPVCAVGLTAGLVVIAAAVMGRPAGTWIPGLVLYGLALAEYINYFHWQLMHDTRADWRRLLRTRRLRRPHLYEDIRVGRRTRELSP
ncbi:multidrug transporter [Streptomyces sp. NPDC050433]|uniref:multidrug transporter n=1 Tax=Streptomyces sp. NPDC050433 TaxID=3365615 RepID=UPI0037B03114